MELIKAIVLIAVGCLLISLPIFMWFFGKTMYHYFKMIMGIKKETYSLGLFLLGPFLLADEKYFDGGGIKNRSLFFSYFKKTLLLFLGMSIFFIVMKAGR